MPAALPPVTDCGCAAAAATIVPTPTTGTCCFLVGLNNPNFDGLLPPNQAVWYEYRQLADLVSGPVAQIWYWNPNLLVWQ